MSQLLPFQPSWHVHSHVPLNSWHEPCPLQLFGQPSDNMSPSNCHRYAVPTRQSNRIIIMCSWFWICLKEIQHFIRRYCLTVELLIFKYPRQNITVRRKMDIDGTIKWKRASGGRKQLQWMRTFVVLNSWCWARMVSLELTKRFAFRSPGSTWNRNPEVDGVWRHSHRQDKTSVLRIDKKLIRRWDSERELSLRRHRTRTTKYNRLVYKFRNRSTRRLCVGTYVYQIQWNNAM